MRYSEQALNRLSVMQAIGSRGPISRTELTAFLKLSSSTITEATADVVRRGLVRERKITSGKSGRPRIALEVNPDGGIVAGTSFTRDGGLAVTFVNLAGETLFQHLERRLAGVTLLALTNALTDALEAAITASGFTRDAISRIAIGLPGLIDREQGVVHWMATMGDEAYPVGHHIEQKLQIPVTVESSSVGIARAEYWFGRAARRSSFLLVHIDRTVVATLVTDGLPSAGSRGFNMEFPHIKVASARDGRECYCGARGCVATYASFVGITAALDGAGAQRDLSSGTPSAHAMDRFRAIMAAAQSGDARYREQFELAGEKLGVAVGNYINALDPGHIILMSSEEPMLDLVGNAFRASVKAVALPALERQTTFEMTTPTPSWREQGMAALALEQVFLAI